MRVSVFGVGYVGCVTAACLAREGHEVVGVDVDPLKVNALNEGRAPFFEPGLSELVKEMVAAGRLHATTDVVDAVNSSEIALVCVGTPTASNGYIRLDYLKQVFTAIGRELQSKSDYFVVALRSTVLPTAIDEELIPILEQSSRKRIGEQIGFVYNPEFLREGVALKDYYEAPWTVIGSNDLKAGEMIERLYSQLPAPCVKTDTRTATLVKYFSNTFHALKVAFGNEVGHFCRTMGVDGTELMTILCRDTKLNISSRYLMPGFAFGGSCLPKDVKALCAEAHRCGIELPILNSILGSNETHLGRCVRAVAEIGKRKIGLVGLTFKEGTDDLRYSPAVELAERLIGKGFEVSVYEPNVARGKLHGSNLNFIERSIPHIWKLLVPTLEELFRRAEVIVVTQPMKAIDSAQFMRMAHDQICVDLVRALSPDQVTGEYCVMDAAQRTEAFAFSATGGQRE